MTKNIIITSFLLATTLSAAAQQPTVTTESRKGELTVTYEAPIIKPSSDYATIVTPMICGQTDTIRLEPVVVRGARNAKKLHRDYVLNHKGILPPAFTPAAVAPSTTSGTVHLSTRQYPWLKNEKLTFAALTESEGCCKVETVSFDESSPFAHMVPFAPVYNKVEENKGRAGELEKLYPVLEHKSKYRPYDESRILRKEKGALYVHFPLDKIDLRYNFRDNDWRLDRIVDITRQITADTTSSVEKIQIIGMASVEGTVPHNHWLAQNRGRALKDYVRREVPTVTEDMFEVIDGGEAWTEFRDQINDVRLLKQGQKMDAKQLGVDAYDLALTDADLSQITMEELDQVLDIIDNEKDLDRREQRLRAIKGGQTYRFLLRTLLADQRNSGYLRVYWDYVPDEIARLINQAVELMRQDKYQEAYDILSQPRVQADHRSWNALGCCHYMLGREDEGIRWFHKADQDGNADARKNLEQLEEK